MISKNAAARAATWAAVAALTFGCTFVDLTPKAEQVRSSTAEAVASCERLGKTKTRTAAKAWIFPRKQARVAEELTRLARADAADMGGTDVAPLDEMADGRQEFGIYRCPGTGTE